MPVISDMAPQDTQAGVGRNFRDTTLPPGNIFGNYVYNSGNHNGEGQNVGFADGHVTWETTPYCGMAYDNIFTCHSAPYTGLGNSPKAPQKGIAGNGPNVADPIYHRDSPPYDTCMVPVRNVVTGAW